MWRGLYGKKLGWPLANSLWRTKTLSLTVCKELKSSGSISSWGTESCQWPLNWEADLSSVEPSDETSALDDKVIAGYENWSRGPREVVPKFLTHSNYELFLATQFVIVCYIAIDYNYTSQWSTFKIPVLFVNEIPEAWLTKLTQPSSDSKWALVIIHPSTSFSEAGLWGIFCITCGFYLSILSHYQE